MDSTKIQAIIFDVDGVIFQSHDEHGNYLWKSRISEDLGLTSKHLSVIFSEKWEQIIRGQLDLIEHLKTVFEEKLFKNIRITPEQYIQYWLNHDHHINQSILDLVKSLPIPCYLGTNQESLRTKHLLKTLGPYFQECFSSYKIGLIKPEEGFFHHIQKTLSLLPCELLLIDDTKNNILGAKNCGWRVYHYQNDMHSLADFLKNQEISNR